jgi:PIN domain nuclease of toxin-antitoxin system
VIRLLLDTRLLLWAAGSSGKLPIEAAEMIDDPGNEPLFSAASLCEVVTNSSLGREDFKVDARLLRRGRPGRRPSS